MCAKTTYGMRIFSSQVIIQIHNKCFYQTERVVKHIYIPNVRTFRQFIKKLYSFLFLLKSYCFLYTGSSYYSDDIKFTLLTTFFFEHLFNFESN